MSGGSQQTVATPSPFDAEKAETQKQLFQVLFPMIVSDLSGGMSANQAKSMAQQNQQKVGAASMAKAAPGTPAMMPGQVKTGNGMMDMALALYGNAPQMPGSSTTNVTPGTMDYLSSGGQLALMAKLLGGNRGGSSMPYISGDPYSSTNPYMVNTPVPMGE